MQPNHLEGHNQASSLSVFSQSSHFAYIYKKTEKLVTAVYMITNFIKDDEPLKWRIRENALELLALNLSFSTVSLSERKDLFRQYQAYSTEIVSLSSIARHSGLISEMNADILKREFNALVAIIEKDENKKANEETVILNPDFFDTSRDKRDYEASAIIAPAPAAIPAAAPASNVLYKGQVPKISRPVVKDMPAKPQHTGDSKEDRQSAILKLLSKKSGLAVKDFTDTIQGVSEKTIQRELLAMVASGVLKKEGERKVEHVFSGLNGSLLIFGPFRCILGGWILVIHISIFLARLHPKRAKLYTYGVSSLKTE